MKQSLFLLLLLFGLLQACQQNTDKKKQAKKSQKEVTTADLNSPETQKKALAAAVKAREEETKAQKAALAKSFNTLILSNSLFANAPKDEVTIEKARIDNGYLELSIVYGGGCGEIVYHLIGGSAASAKMDVRLAFKDKDNCEALKRKTIRFDISPAKVAESHQTVLQLKGWKTPLTYKY